MMTTSIKRKRREGGNSIVEVALLAPWIFFLFVGIFDFGFYSYAAICTQNAARAVALTAAQTATSTVTPCNAALGEMRMLPNVGYTPSFSCGSGTSVTQSAPVAVCVGSLSNTAATVCGLSSAVCGDCALNNAATSQFATVTYQTIPFVPIPGLLTGQMTLTRGAEVRQTTP
jgi:Flp pilus assembly protein TadG